MRYGIRRNGLVLVNLCIFLAGIFKVHSISYMFGSCKDKLFISFASIVCWLKKLCGIDKVFGS